MRNIKLIIEYDGTRYQGWQRLGDSDKTIQGKLEKIVSQLTEETIELIGSGRTDAGTHARGQVANFKTNCNKSLEEMHHFFLKYLPKDIVVTSIDEVPERFHARYNAVSKQYSYYVRHAELPSAFNRNYHFYVAEPLDWEAMTEACLRLTGTHDFLGFSALKKSKKSTVRTIESIEMEKEEAMIRFVFRGDGFLYKMVRIMMGTILAVGKGEMTVNQIDDIFQAKIRQAAGETVPAQGLFLDGVFYEKN
ncbi:tRNA pseudouridine(38-40) synthase TruA [Enterococcus italicus]|uniref:tRNA pseudouridine(38-40) synthase TruA n=1 Tax=Enterococcus italicus TaxID=246144 RepID=UPI0020734D6D|nr:tRNA pseudouridine(38-40) synthase TruA [Enterococcus italicus]MCM6880140.1 tRNA pseudouridine(38-40) synthase TruA [Enterococcus italicus]